MMVLRVSILAAMTLSIGACGGTPACQESQPYQSSRLGEHITAPEGLDPLESSRELTIPEPSPRPPRPANAPCLESPPSMQTETITETDDTQE